MRAAGAPDRIEVGAVAGCEADPGDGDDLHRRILELAMERILVEEAIPRRKAPVDHTASLGERHPRVNVRRKLEVGREDHVAWLEREREGGEVDAEARVDGERDRLG